MAYLDPLVNMMFCISRIPPFANLLTNQSSLIRDVGLTGLIFYVEAVSFLLIRDRGRYSHEIFSQQH